jgi:hypothetical protein
MSDLPIEKQFLHDQFCRQVQTINLEQAKELLKDLHHLYLGQQTLFARMAKDEAKQTRERWK